MATHIWAVAVVMAPLLMAVAVAAGPCDDCQGPSGNICCLIDGGDSAVAPGCVSSSSECLLARDGMLAIPASPKPAALRNPKVKNTSSEKWFKQSAPLFESLPSKDSVDQGHMGDCWLISTLGAVASTQWGPVYLESIMRQVGDSVYTQLYSCEDADECGCDDGGICMAPRSAFTPRVVKVADTLPRGQDGRLIDFAGGRVEGKAIQSFAHRGLFASFIEKAAAAGFSPVDGTRNSFKFSDSAGMDSTSLDGANAQAGFGMIFGVGEIQSVLSDGERQDREEHDTMKKFLDYDACLELFGNEEFCHEVRKLPQFNDQYDVFSHPCEGTTVRFKLAQTVWHLGDYNTATGRWRECELAKGSDTFKECSPAEKRIQVKAEEWKKADLLEYAEVENFGRCEDTVLDNSRRHFENSYSYRRLETSDIAKVWLKTAQENELSMSETRDTLDKILVNSGLPGVIKGRYHYWGYQQDALDKMMEWAEKDLPMVAWTKRVFKHKGETFGGREAVPLRFNLNAGGKKHPRVGDFLGGRDDDSDDDSNKLEWHTFSTSISRPGMKNGYVMGGQHQVFVTGIVHDSATNQYQITIHNPYGRQTYDAAKGRWVKYLEWQMRDSYTLDALKFFRLFHQVVTCEECRDVALDHIAATTEAEWSRLQADAPFPPGAVFECLESNGQDRMEWFVKNWVSDKDFWLENVAGEKNDRHITPSNYHIVEKWCDRVGSRV